MNRTHGVHVHSLSMQLIDSVKVTDIDHEFLE
jgi:hypothetical protein